METKHKVGVKRYRVTREFIGGELNGLKHSEITTVRFPEGWVCEKPIGGSSYRIVECVEVDRLPHESHPFLH